MVTRSHFFTFACLLNSLLMKIHAESFWLIRHVRFFLPADGALKLRSKLRLSLKTVTNHTKGGGLPQAKVRREKDKNGVKEKKGGKGDVGVSRQNYSSLQCSKKLVNQMPLQPFSNFPPSSVKSPPRKTCFVWRMTASRPVIIETCLSVLCSTRSPPVSPIWIVLSCGFVANQHEEEEDGVSFSWLTEGRLMVLMSDFPKSPKCCVEVWRLAGLHTPSAVQVMSCHHLFTNGMLQHLDIVVVAGWKTMSHFIRSLLAESCSSH